MLTGFKKTSAFSTWVVVFICVLGCEHLYLGHKGSDTILIPGDILKHKGGTACGLLESRWVLLPSVPETIAFYIH